MTAQNENCSITEKKDYGGYIIFLHACIEIKFYHEISLIVYGCHFFCITVGD